jgi:mxaK protein
MAKRLRHMVHRHLLGLSLAAMVISLAMIAWSVFHLYAAYDYANHRKARTLSLRTDANALLLNATLYAERGQSDKALSAYAQLAAQGDEAFSKVAYFNSGNLYLMQAIQLLEQETLMGWDGAGPLLALAKTSYQRALNIDPSWSEAKYNFELALRLSPANHGRKGPHEYEREDQQEDERPSGWPSIPGSPHGMP